MPEVPTPQHERKRHQCDDVANAEKKKNQAIAFIFSCTFYLP